VHKISIVPRGRAALGYTLQLPTGDHNLLTRGELIDRIQGLLGGRAAEEIMLGDVSTGAENDLEQATTLARRLVAQFGMGESAGLMHCARSEQALRQLDARDSLQRDCSEKTASAIDEEVRGLLDDAYAAARETLTKYRDELERVAEALLVEETLDREAIDRLIGVRL
jgi:cell division protease FtsH